jgi:NAD(P)-dependent dehydrogenase (short-subunit alcohol dehydrogenase family)
MEAMEMTLEDKVAVITGGSSGIGLAIADAYRREGAKVVIFGRRPDALAAAERLLNDSILTVQGDVTNRSDLERLFEATAERFGSVDVLVANAGSFNFTLLVRRARRSLIGRAISTSRQSISQSKPLLRTSATGHR